MLARNSLLARLAASRGFHLQAQRFGLFSLGNLFDSTFVILDLAVDSAHGAGVFGDPDGVALLAIDLGFEIRDGILFAA